VIRVELITVLEAAKKVNKTPSALYLAIRKGALKAELKYGLNLISIEELEKYNPRPRGRPRGLTDRNANLRTDISQSELARELGVSRQCINQIMNREARNARSLVAAALKSGKITKAVSCERCKTDQRRLEGHHPDYFKPLEVLWLCPPCHSLIHPHHPNVHGKNHKGGRPRREAK
jgi:hypothetical protein